MECENFTSDWKPILATTLVGKIWLGNYGSFRNPLDRYLWFHQRRIPDTKLRKLLQPHGRSGLYPQQKCPRSTSWPQPRIWKTYYCESSSQIGAATIFSGHTPSHSHTHPYTPHFASPFVFLFERHGIVKKQTKKQTITKTKYVMFSVLSIPSDRISYNELVILFCFR